MTITSAFLVPGSPLPVLRHDVQPWNQFNLAMQRAGAALRDSSPDVVLVYSTQWFAVLDEIWLTRRRSEDIHVDENWHEFGELPYDLYSDVDLANKCVESCQKQGVNARGADYKNFPIDTGSIVASGLLGIGTEALPFVLASNNLYDNGAATEKLAQIAVSCANEQGKKVAVVGVGGLSGSVFTTDIDPNTDRIVKPEEDAWNKRMLTLIESGDCDAVRALMPTYAKEARVDMGFKHFNWILGAAGGSFSGARVHHYGALYGSGAAVIEFQI
ncbi:2-aminophenol 1,6-dioxygenase alpha subunit [Paraburkholderia nemoris]|uniref:DODA-type extradiol aromatic ring-opening family dioxygenase n=1 Tax=Paraburkholderia nemoris TaxID=2793076 RepID=UPI00191272A0|nr:tRNA U-34 5-methylaminomethyl-2-thiouridine biosynthesis protein [Paraburkholderia nemoris]MBK5151364.1 tRNA U-34 5-methylaminomethyl-2-thiouridine biosynthesis protein [Burkholderia sp. R-69608]CAE6952187.1 2-aminophenol 1,6-dioxygenase alpha subunit [Paraburkholderia nemoris]